MQEQLNEHEDVSLTYLCLATLLSGRRWIGIGVNVVRIADPTVILDVCLIGVTFQFGRCPTWDSIGHKRFTGSKKRTRQDQPDCHSMIQSIDMLVIVIRCSKTFDNRPFE